MPYIPEGKRITVYKILEKTTDGKIQTPDTDRVIFVSMTRARSQKGNYLNFFRNYVTENDSDLYNDVSEYINAAERRNRGSIYARAITRIYYHDVYSRNIVSGIQDELNSMFRYP